jgi:hypothetical protein
MPSDRSEGNHATMPFLAKVRCQGPLLFQQKTPVSAIGRVLQRRGFPLERPPDLIVDPNNLLIAALSTLLRWPLVKVAAVGARFQRLVDFLDLFVG